MPGPNDYISPLLQASINPAQSFSQGLQIGNQIVDNQRAAVADQRQGLMFAQAQQDRSAAIEAAKAQAIAQAQKAVAYQDDLEAFKSNRTTDGALAMAAAYPEQTDQWLKQHTALSKEIQDRRLGQMVRTKALLASGQKFTAIDQLQRDALALDESDPREAEILRRQADGIDKDPSDGSAQIDLYLASVAPKELAESNEKLGLKPAVIAKAAADAKKAEVDADVAAATALDAALAGLALDKANADNVRSMIKFRAADFGLKQSELAQRVSEHAQSVKEKAGMLDPTQQKDLMSTIASAEASNMAAEDLGALISSIDEKSKGRLPGARGMETGLMGQAGRAITNAAGWEGANTADDMALKKIMAGEVKANKADATMGEGERIEAEKAMPTLSSPDKVKTEWLNKMKAKREASARVDVARSEFLQENKSYNRATKPIVVGGVEFPAGTTVQQVISLARSPAAAPEKFAAKSTAPTGQVRVQKPDGSVGLMPAASVDRAAIEAAGGRVL